MSAREELFAAIATATAHGRYDEAAMIGLVDALVTEALVAAGVQYVDCHLCGAARPVAGTCGNCTFKTWVAAEQAARGFTVVDATEAVPAPDFFVPGRVYTRTLRTGIHAPTPVHLRFVCEHVTKDPKIGDREAWGWVLRSNGTRAMDRLWDHDMPLWTPEAGGDRG